MGLLNKALLYREELLKSAPKGLLFRALKYLESKNSQFPETTGNVFGSTDYIEKDKTYTTPAFDLDFKPLGIQESESILTDEIIPDLNEEDISLADNDYAVDLKNEVESYDEIDIEENIAIPEDIKDTGLTQPAVELDEDISLDENESIGALENIAGQQETNAEITNPADEIFEEEIISLKDNEIIDESTGQQRAVEEGAGPSDEVIEEEIIALNENEKIEEIEPVRGQQQTIEETTGSSDEILEEEIISLNENEAAAEPKLILEELTNSPEDIYEEEVLLLNENEKLNETEIVGEQQQIIEETSGSSGEVFDELEDVDEESTDINENEAAKTVHNPGIYYDIINNISKDMSTLIVDDRAYKKFSDIISDNFNMTKSALMIYFPPKQKFILWNGKSLDDESSAKLYFDLEFNNIYKNLSKEKSYFIRKDDKSFKDFSSLFSEYDYNDAGFILWIPFIFSARIIGIYLGLKLKDRKLPSSDMINSLEILGRLNGPLLYNLYQQETIRQQQQKITKNNEKKNYTEAVNEIKPVEGTLQEVSSDLLDDYDKNQTDNIIVQLNDMEEVEKPVSITESEDAIVEEIKNDKIELSESDLKEVDLFDIFPENIHKLIYFAQQTITNSPESPLTLIHIVFGNNDEIQNTIPDFRFETFYSDIQFVIMNVVGTNGFVQILRDMNIYIVLPEIKKSMAYDMLNEISSQLNGMFKEIHEDAAVSLKNNIVNYPDDAKDYLELFYKIQKL